MKVTIPGSMLEVEKWEERDRLHLELKGKAYPSMEEVTVLEAWDDDARQLIEDGFIDPRRLEASMTEYALHMGILEKTAGGYLMGAR